VRTTGTTTANRRTDRAHVRRSFLGTLAACCGAGLCLLTGCSADTGADSAMTVTVSAVTDAPTLVWFDTRERHPSGIRGRGLDPTPVELSPQRPSADLPVPHDRGNWIWVRVAGPDRPPGSTIGCRLRTTDGRVLAADATDPLGPPTDEAACGGSG
jgi:hypothetical protein